MRYTAVVLFLLHLELSRVLPNPSGTLTLIGIFLDDSSNVTYSQTVANFLESLANRTHEKLTANKTLTVDLYFRACAISPDIRNVSDTMERCTKSNETVLISLLPTDAQVGNYIATWADSRGILLIEEFVDSDRRVRYPFISSPDPTPDRLSQAMVTTVKHMQWNYVQIIAQESQFFNEALQSFTSSSASHNVCALNAFRLKVNSTDSHIHQVLQDLDIEKDTKAVLLFTDSFLTRKFFAIRKSSTFSNNFYFITTSASFQHHHKNLGTLTVGQFQPRNELDFKDLAEFQQLPETLVKTLGAVENVMLSENICSDTNVSKPVSIKCLVEALKRELDNASSINIYNLQRNYTEICWQQVGVIKTKSAAYETINQPIFYDIQGNPLNRLPVSISDPFRYECRNGISYTTYISGPADLYILGVLPIHASSRTPSGCGLLSPDNVLLSEAVSFGVQLINEDETLLSGQKLGYVIIDYCSVPDRVISQLDRIFSSSLNGYDTSLIYPNLIAAIGFPDSENYMELSGYLSSRNVLTISTTAAKHVLSDKTRYPDFMRMVSPRSEEVIVLLKIVQDIGVSHFGVAFSDTEDEENNVLSLMKHAEELGLSISYVMPIDEKRADDQNLMDEMVRTFISKNADIVRTVVCFTKASDIVALLHAVERIRVPKMLWIGSDQWYSSFLPEDLHEFENVIENAIVVGFRSHKLIPFMNHTSKITNDTNNPFIQELLLERRNCKIEADKLSGNNVCLTDSHWVLEDIAEHSDATFVVDAVRAIALGFEQLSKNHCHGKGVCTNIRQKLIGYLQDSIYNTPFIGISQNDVKFDSKNDGPVMYDIYQIRFLENTADKMFYKKVGTFDKTTLALNKEGMIIPDFIENTCGGKSCPNLPPNLLETLYAFIDGDPIIYAFVGIYRSKNGQTCSTDIHTGGYQEVESLIWSVKQINNDKSFLHDLSLGLRVFDTCALQSRTEHLIESILRPGFMISSTNVIRNNVTVLGIVGGSTNPGAVGIELGTRLVDNEIPVIISSGTPMPDARSHPRLYRTLPSSYEEMDFVLDLCLRFKWTYIHVLHIDKANTTVDYLEKVGKANGICFASRNVLSFSYTMNELEDIMRNMLSIDGATAVVVMVPPFVIRDLFRAAHDVNTAGRLFFVFPNDMENLENVISNFASTAMGFISVRQNLTVNPNFMKYLLSLDILDEHYSPWFPAFWEEVHQCNLRYSTKYSKDCTADIHLNETSVIAQNVDTTSNINGLYALSKAFSDYLKACPDSTETCTKTNPSTFYSSLDKYLSAVKVTPPGGNSFNFRKKNGTTSLLVMNLQPSPGGALRLVNIGSYSGGKLTLDTRKASFYKYGKRIIPDSKCTGLCKHCMDLAFVSAYEKRVLHLVNLGPILKTRFNDAIGAIGFILITVGLGFVAIATYYLQQNYRHKVFNLCVDASTGVIVGSALMVLSSISFMFSQTQGTCTVQLGIPGCAYLICLGSLIIKLNKSAALRDVVGVKQVRVPRWTFLFTYLPILIVAYAIMCYAWVMGQYVHMEWTVPEIHYISSVDDVTIQWSCVFDRSNYAMHMTPFWFLLFETLILSFYYFLRHTNQPEVKQVLYSSVVSLFMLLIPTLVVTLADDMDVYCTLMVLTSTFNGMILIVINFIPPVVTLMQEEQKLHGFSEFMMKEKAAEIGKLWRKPKRGVKTMKTNTAENKAEIDSNKEVDKTKVENKNRWKKGMSVTFKADVETLA